MSKCSSQDPALGGSIVSSAKRTDELPSKHNQARRGAKRQSSSSMPKVSCNDYSFNSSSQHMDGWNKPVIWAKKEDDNTKGEVAGWPRWETVSNQTFPGDAYEDDSTIAYNSWIESEDGNAKRVTGEGGDAIYHDGLDKWRQSSPNIHMEDKNSLSKSACWDRPAHSNGKQETGGWTRWPEAMSKTIGQYNSHQNSRGCWNQSEGWTTSKDSSTMPCKRDWNEYGDEREKKENGCDSFDHDGDGWRQSRSNIHIVDKGSSRKSASWDHAKCETANRENNGWHIWSGSMTKTTRQFPSHQKRKGYRNQSERWTTSEDGSAMACKRGWNESGDGKEKREIHGDATDHDDGDGWRQSRSNIHLGDKGSLSKSASLDRAKYENVKRENDGWPGAMSETTRQSTGHQDRKVYLNQTEGWTTSQNGSTMACKRGWNESGDGREERENGGDVFDQDNRDGWRLSGSNIHSIDKGSLSKSASWDGAKDENAKRENDGWCRWPEAMSKTTRQCTSHQNSQSKGWTTSKDDSNISCTRGWNESGDGKEKRETADGGDAFNHDGRDGWKSSSSNIHRVDKGSLSKSASWDRAKDENAKRDNDGWPGWPGAMPKTIEQFPSHQNRKVGWQSQGWTASDDGVPQKETRGRNPDLVQSGDPWMQRGSMMSPKCDWDKPVTWNASKGDGLDRGQRKWDPGLDQTGGDPWKQISPTVLPKAGRRKFGSATVAQGENSIRRKSKWSGSANFSDPYASKQHRMRWGASMPSTREQCPSSQNRKDGWNQSWGRIPSEYGDSLKENNGRIADLDRSDDPWMEHRLMMLPKCDWNKSASWSETGGNDQTGRDPWEQLNPPELPKFVNSFRKNIKLSAAPDFSDPNAPKQNMHIFLPKNDGKRLFRGRGRTPYHASEHEHYQSNDTCNTYKKVSGGVSAYDGDSPLGRSQSGSLVRNQISDAVRKHPDSDTDEFWDSKKAPRYPGHDRRTSFEDPWKQRNHLQDTESSKHWSRNDEAGENKLFPNDTSYDRFPREKGSYHDSFSDRGCPVKDKCKEIWHDRRDSNPCDDKWDQKNTGNVSSWNFSKLSSKIIVKDSLSQTHLMRDDERFKDNTIMSMGTTPVQNVDQNVTNSPHVCQQSAQNLGSHINDQTDHSSPIQRQNVQISSQLPFRTKNSNPNGQCQKPPSNPKDELQNHEQQAMLNIRDSLTTEAITILVSSCDPVFVQAPINTEELKTSSEKVEQVPITVGISDFSKKIIETMNFPYSKSWNTYQFEPVNVQAKGETYSGNYEQHVGPNGELNGRMDEKGIRMFKFAIAEFVKETIKPVWNDGRLSKEAHKTVVKKVVDKVVGVLGTNIPQTQERIDQYLSYAKDKLHKLVQDYLEMFINT